MTKKPVIESKGAATYADEILMRKLGVDFSNEYISYDMNRGNQLEPDAIYLYEKLRLTEVEAKERVFHPEYDFISGEPDGLIGQRGLIEIKCPNKKNHLANYRNGEQRDKYNLQIQGYMFLTGRAWCDFVSYNPDFPEGMQLAVWPVKRDQDLIDDIETRCREFWDDVMIPKLKEFDLDPELEMHLSLN